MSCRFLNVFIMALFFVWSRGASAQDNLPEVRINEFMAANSNTILSSDFKEYADWLELFNGGDSIADIGGFYLTDDLQDPQKWQIPADTKILPGRTILFWADGRNKGRHTSFKLDRSGETIGLFSPKGIAVDLIRYTEQSTDISFGRYPDGADNWFFFENPTPASSNTNPGYSGICPEPKFSPEGGFYRSGAMITLSSDDPEAGIRYTTDGSIPNQESSVYSSPISLNKTTVIRARTFRQGYIPGKVVTHTFFIDEPTTLPVVSVATNPANLWDDEIGIYVVGTNGITGYCSTEPRNWNQPWERPISLELYEADRRFAFKLDAGMQIGGGCTRKYPQKTLAVYARSEYGYSKIEYPVFDDKPIQTYNNLLLRNSGQDWWRALIRDGTMHTLVKDHMDIDWQAYKPAVVFLNGEYWGIHGIREKHNEHYLAANYGIDPDEIDILSGNAVPKQGSARYYTAMIDYIKVHDLSVPEHYQWVCTQMDINEYLNYVIAEIYFANIDWPGGNIKYWRQQGEGHKWRWILFDLDLGFGAHGQGQYDSNTLANATATAASYYANPPWATYLLRSLLKNNEFRHQFIQRCACHLNITFDPERVLNIIDSLKSAVAAEIPRHLQKWEQSTSFNDGWDYHIAVMQEFAVKRPGYMFQHLIEKFNLSGTAELQVRLNPPKSGRVIMNNVTVLVEGFSGTFLKDIPIECVAIANRGFRFAGWQGISESTADSIQIILTADGSLHAIFEADASTDYKGLLINEILALNGQTNTDEFGETDDWIELFNDSPEAVDVGGMYLTDDLARPRRWQISADRPDLTTIAPGGFLLLWADNDPDQGVLHLDFRLSGDGEQIGLSRLTDMGLIFVDTLVFGAQTADVSYGRYPDGSETLQFFSVPTPGSGNSTTGITAGNPRMPRVSTLGQNHPNPFNPITTIRYTVGAFAAVADNTETQNIASLQIVDLSVYNIRGQKIATLVSGQKAPGTYKVSWDASALPSGVYIYHLRINGDHLSRKMILLR